MVHLVVCQRCKAIQVVICCVQHLEHPAPVSLLQQFVAGKFMHMQIITFLHHLCQFSELLGHFLRHLHATLHIVVVLLKPHLLHVAGIVRVVVAGIHRAILLETLDEHSLAVGIGEAHWACHLGHSALAAPLFNSFQQRFRYLQVVDEVEPAVSHHLLFPSFVGIEVDDCSHTPHRFAVFISNEIVCFALLERCVLPLVKRVHLVKEKVWHIVRVVFIKVVPKLNEL